MIRDRRWTAAVVIVAVLAAGSVFAEEASAATVPTVSTTSLVAPVDYFVNQWNDPMDFSNSEDLNLTELMFPQGGTRTMANGQLTVSGAGQIVLLRHDPGALPTSAIRDPQARRLNADYFTRISFRMHSDRFSEAGAIGFRTCDSCSDAYRFFEIQPGWHTYDLDMVGTDDHETFQGQSHSVSSGGWSGSVGLVYIANAFNSSTKPTLTLDDVKIYHPLSSATVTLPSGSGSVELWADTDGDPSNDGSYSGGVGPSANRIGTFSAGSTVSISSGLVRPDTTTRFYTSQSGAKSGVSAAVTEPGTSVPSPNVLAPTELGGSDFATEVAGSPWDMDASTDVLKTFNLDASFHDGAMFGSAAGNKNDPVVILNLGPRQIDATLYHKVVITMNYDGPFGLEDAPNGGLVGRFVWSAQDGQHEQVSSPFVVTPGRRTYVVSLRSSPPKAILDPTGNSEWIGWGTGITTFVSMLRFDPHEDPGNRTWQIDDVKLLRDEAVNPTFDIRFRDDSWASGTTADLYADTDRDSSNGLGTLIAGGVSVGAGDNSYRWDGSGLASGPYYIHLALHRGGNVVVASSTGAVAVGMSGAGTPPASVPLGGNPTATGYSAAQVQAFITFIAQAKRFCTALRVRKLAAGNHPICVAVLGKWAKNSKKKSSKKK